MKIRHSCKNNCNNCNCNGFSSKKLIIKQLSKNRRSSWEPKFVLDYLLMVTLLLQFLQTFVI